MACSLLGAQWEGRAEGLSSAKGSRPPPRARVRVPRAVTTCLPSPPHQWETEDLGALGAGAGWCSRRGCRGPELVEGGSTSFPPVPGS